MDHTAASRRRVSSGSLQEMADEGGPPRKLPKSGVEQQLADARAQFRAGQAQALEEQARLEATRRNQLAEIARLEGMLSEGESRDSG